LSSSYFSFINLEGLRIPAKNLFCLVFLNPFSEDLAAAADQVINSYVAFGNGGLFGRGLGNSIQKLGYLPEAHTDFILAIVGEELGFIVVWLVLVVLFFLIIYIFWKAQFCRSLFSRYLCLGVGIFLLVQSGVNIGALLGLAPITGVPLPFLSYGGSSFVVSSIAIGMVLFALKYDKEYEAYKMNDIKLFETEVEENENQDKKGDLITQDGIETEVVLKSEDIKEEEHEEITGG